MKEILHIFGYRRGECSLKRNKVTSLDAMLSFLVADALVRDRKKILTVKPHCMTPLRKDCSGLKITTSHYSCRLNFLL